VSPFLFLVLIGRAVGVGVVCLRRWLEPGSRCRFSRRLPRGQRGWRTARGFGGRWRVRLCSLRGSSAGGSGITGGIVLLRLFGLRFCFLDLGRWCWWW